MTPKIVLLVISYKKPELVHTLLKSLSKLEARDQVLTLVIDNDSDLTTRESLKDVAMDSVQVLFEKKNWGYFGGAQRGLEWIREKGLKPEWVIISNSDIEFPEAQLWARLVKADVPANLGVIAPRITSAVNGLDQNPFFVERPPARKMHFYKWCFRWYVTGAAYGYLGLIKNRLKAESPKAKYAAKPEALERREIYAPHGAFIIFHRYYFERGCDFAHGVFLYNEEFTVAENCRAHGLKVIHDPSLVVKHEEHATLGARPSRAVIRFHGEASQYTADKYFPL